MLQCGPMSDPNENHRDTVSVRPAILEDVPKIIEIERLCYPAPCVPWTEEGFRLEIEKPFSRTLLLTDDETDSVVAGYIVFWLLAGEGHILNLAIHPEWRGVGLGTKLVRQVVNMAVREEMQRIFLEVRKSNSGAVGLYQKIGFFIDHIKPRFYENGESAYFMVLNMRNNCSF